MTKDCYQIITDEPALKSFIEWLPEHSAEECYFHKGIKVCERWQNSFSAFYEDMGPRPSHHHSIDRIDSDGDYCPKNCRWATSIEQNRNRGNNTIIEFNGENKTLAEWAEIYKLDRSTITSRIFKYGWSIKDALTTPVGYRNPAKYPNSKITYEKKS